MCFLQVCESPAQQWLAEVTHFQHISAKGLMPLVGYFLKSPPIPEFFPSGISLHDTLHTITSLYPGNRCAKSTGTPDIFRSFKAYPLVNYQSVCELEHIWSHGPVEIVDFSIFFPSKNRSDFPVHKLYTFTRPGKGVFPIRWVHQFPRNSLDNDLDFEGSRCVGRDAVVGRTLGRGTSDMTCHLFVTWKTGWKK